MLMTRNEILNQLKEILILADNGSRETVENSTEQTQLVTDLGLNSVNILYLVIAAEEIFGIEFDDVGINSFVTVGDVIDYIEGKLK